MHYAETSVISRDNAYCKLLSLFKLLTLIPIAIILISISFLPKRDKPKFKDKKTIYKYFQKELNKNFFIFKIIRIKKLI